MAETVVLPEPQPMRRAFDHVYLADASLWDLPSRQRSKEVLRRVALLARSFRLPARLSIVTHSHACPTEYVRMAALAGASDADIDAFLVDYHAQHAQHPYPAALFDPAGRTGRWP